MKRLTPKSFTFTGKGYRKICKECESETKDNEDTLETICAVVLNDKNQILPYTCQSTIQACDEWCDENLPGWEKMKKLGAKVVQSKIILI